VSRTTVDFHLKKKESVDSVQVKPEESSNFHEIILDKNSLNKICVKDIHLMIELIEKEIFFNKQRKPGNHKPIQLKIPMLLAINKLGRSKRKIPKLR
jgi:hypothetical protein